MLKRLTCIWMLVLYSTVVNADFNFAGKGTLRYPTGVETPFEFGFTLVQRASGNIFHAGTYEMEVSQVPEKYSIWISVHEDKHVYVQEFAGGYFEGFTWLLGEHQIILKKKVNQRKKVPGNYVLSVDGVDHFLKGKSGSVDVYFDSKGIKDVDLSGFVKDLGISE
ncbi:MAG: hypothetical protein GJ680_10345 [Alteromonadaceae bacterium]|nr:hypothetical protein [Alteromonadaceae bacterium]